MMMVKEIQAEEGERGIPSLNVKVSGVFSGRRERHRHIDRGPYLYDIPTPHSCRIYDQSIYR